MPSRRRFLRTIGAGAVATTGVAVANTSSPSHVQWSRSPGGDEYQFGAATVSHDGGLVIAGRTGSSNRDSVWLVALDATGDVRWKRTYDGPGFVAPSAITPVDGGYVFTGTVGPASRRAWVVSVDTQGKEIWTRTYGRIRQPRSVIATSRGLYIAGNAGPMDRTDTLPDQWVLALTPDGQPRWRRTYGPGVLTSVAVTETGILAAGNAMSDRHDQQTSADRTHDAALLALTQTGDVSFHHTFGGVHFEAVQAVTPVQSGAVYVGETGSPDVSGERSRTALLVRTDSQGRMIWRRTPNLEQLGDVVSTARGLVAVGDVAGRPMSPHLLVFDRWGHVQHQFRIGKSGWVSEVHPAGDDSAFVAGGGSPGLWATRVDISP